MSEKNKIQTQQSNLGDDIDLGKLIGTLLDNKWLFVGITSIFAVMGVVYILFATPIYKADALVQVEQNIGNSLIDDLSSVLPKAKPGSDAEIKLITSRLVLGKTVDDLNLETEIKQHYLPLIGKGWARITGDVPGKILLSYLNLPSDTDSEKDKLQLRVEENSKYTILRNNEKFIEGKIGEKTSSDDFSIFVVDIQAKYGTIFDLSKRSRTSVIREIQRDLEVEDSGKDTGVLNLSLVGEDKEKIQKVLESVIQNYLFQNVERKSAEAEKSLAFLKEQLPEVRYKLDSAEDKLNYFRQENDSVDMSLETKSVLDKMVNLEAQLNELTFREAEISKLYTKSHPAYRTLLEKRKTLEDEKTKLDKKVGGMPKTQQEILRLTRDVQSGQAVYMQLLNKQQELSISKASTIGNVRIVDNALTQPEIVKPQKWIVIIVSIILGLLVSVFTVVVKILLYRGIENPSVLEEAGINVYASVPLSEWQQKKDRDFYQKRKINNKRKEQAAQILAIGNPTDLAVEAVRSIRTSLHFAMMEAKNNILMISGASPSIGKTFICTNLAVVIAQSGKRILLIDSDMRKGYTHTLLGLSNDSGLSDILSNQKKVENAVRNTGIEHFDIITRGQVPPNPSELLMSVRFDELLTWASNNYDIVLIDTPPILAVTDAAIVGSKAGTSLMVVRYGMNTLKEVEVSINRFSNNGIDIKGVILNSVIRTASNYYGSYGYYQYEYKNEK